MLRQSHLTIFTLVLIVHGLSLHHVGAQQQGYRPEVGEQHLDFTLPRIDNRQPLTLSDFRGKKVLLLHFASW